MKTNKIQPGSFEEDLLWMSIRYCIGRHSIASCMHAGAIASNTYNKLEVSRKEWIAKDIRREINDILSWKGIDLSSSFRYNDDCSKCAFDAYCESYNNLLDNGHNLENVKRINCSYDCNKLFYEYQFCEEGEEKKYGFPFVETIHSEYRDLHNWYTLMKCFYVSNHVIVHTKDYGDIRAFQDWWYNIETNRFEEIYRGIDMYIKHGQNNVWITPEPS